MVACGSVGKLEDGSHLTQLRNQFAIRDSRDGDIRDVVQVAAENLMVVANYFLDTAGYVWKDSMCRPGGRAPM